jgi:hypothetical protein
MRGCCVAGKVFTHQLHERKVTRLLPLPPFVGRDDHELEPCRVGDESLTRR